MTLPNVLHKGPVQMGRWVLITTVFTVLMLLPSSLFSKSCTPPPSGLVSWWPGEGNGHDLVGGNAGTLFNGVTFVPGMVGQAFNFDGVAGHVRVKDAANLRFTNAVTVEAWVNPTQVGGGSLRTILEKWDAVVGVNQRSYGLNFDAAGYATFGTSSNGVDAGASVLSTSVIPTNQWTHIAGTFDGTTLKIYLNGLLNNTLSYGGAIFYGTSDFAIGGVVGGVSPGSVIAPFAGLIDEPAVYSRALTDSEIMTIFNSDSAGKCQTPAPPAILTFSSDQTVPQGTNVTFNVTATGATPLGYQWRVNGTNIGGATNASLTLTNVQLAQSGNNYSVVVSNVVASTNSANALLTVTGGICTPPAPGMIGWWPGDNNPNDIIGGHNGTAVGITYTAGRVNTAFNISNASTYVDVPHHPSLNPTNVITTEAWIFPRLPLDGIASPIIKKAGIGSGPITASQQSTGYGLEIVGTNGVLLAVHLGGVWRFSPAAPVPFNSWSHVAGVYNGSNILVYINGQLATSNTTVSGPIAPSTNNLQIGHDFCNPGRFYNGLIDEPAVYGVALSAAYIQAIYNAGSAGKCAAAPPVITGQPTNQTVPVGGNATFAVTATGSQPLGYQWRVNGTNIGGATNVILTLTNVQLGQSGNNYSVVVSNFVNTTTSSNALLTVNGAICTPAPSGVISWWPGEVNAHDLVGGNAGALFNGVTFVPGKVGQAFSFDGVSRHVRIKDAPNLCLTNALTMEAWVYPTSVGGGAFRTILHKWDAVLGVNQRSYGLYLDTSGFATFTTSSNGVDMGATVLSTNVVPINQWIHIAATFDGTTLRLYLNGLLNNTLPYGGTIFPGTSDLAIGGVVGGVSPGSAIATFAGLIDEPTIYSRALTGTEILTIFNSDGVGKCQAPTAPTIVTHPAGQTLPSGANGTFNVIVSGATPLGYQWRVNGTNIGGATNNSLTVTNAQLVQSGNNYSVVVSNFVNTATSSNALLTVTGGTCAPAPLGIISWWPGNNNTDDVVGGRNGTAVGITYVAGKVSTAFNISNTSTYVDVPDHPSLNPTNVITTEAWIFPRLPQVGVANPIIKKGGIGSGPITALQQSTGYGLELLGTNGVLFGVHQGGVWRLTPTAPIPFNAWSHVAGVYNGTNVLVYVNGQLAGSTAASGAFTPSPNNLQIGHDVSNPIRFYNGLIDEPAVYGVALSAAQIQAIYNAGTNGKCAAAPVITGQPTNRTVPVGSNATFAVTATGSQPLGYQWRVNGTNIGGATNTSLVVSNVQLVQSGNNYSVVVSNFVNTATSSNALLTVTGGICTPPAPGMIAWWPGDNNPNDIIGGHNGTAVGITYVAGKVSTAFNISNTSTYVDVPDHPSLNPTNVITTEAWIFPRLPQVGVASPIIKKGGIGSGPITALQQSTGYGLELIGTNGVLFGVHQGGVWRLTPTAPVPFNAWSHVAGVYNGTNVLVYVNGQLAGSTAASGAFTPSPNNLQIGHDVSNPIRFYNGLIDEPAVYGVALSAAQIQAIYNAGSAGKCADVAPVITGQPANQAVPTGSNATFAVTATGSQPLGYQWRVNGTNIGGATNNSLVLTNVQLAQSGNNYSVVVSNFVNTAISSNALLTVSQSPAVIQVVSVTASGVAVVPINLLALGNENALGFSINFDTSRLTFASVTLGSNASGATLLINTNLVGSGKLGLGIGLATNSTFAAGTNEVATISFITASVTNTVVSAVTFGDQPTTRQLSDPMAQVLAANYVAGSVTIPFLGYEGDVVSRPNGDGTNAIADWVQAGRFVAGLDALMTNANEFQRADSAPRSTLGDGLLAVSDWVQAGRYAIGLDPKTSAGGPTQPGGGPLGFTPLDLTGRTITAVGGTVQADETAHVTIQLDSQGDENALGFSVSFDSSALAFTGASLGAGANGATLHVNSNAAGSGTVGLALALPVGAHFSAGTLDMVNLDFTVSASASDKTPISFGSEPVIRQVADVLAETLPTAYVNGSLTILPLVIGSGPVLTITQSGGDVVISWPAAATGYLLEGTGDITSTNWANVPVVAVTNATDVSVTIAPTNSQSYYRLRRPLP